MSIKKFVRFRILLIVLFTGLLVLLPSLLSGYLKTEVSAQSSRLPATYVGVWEGKGVQDTGSQWSILIALTPGGVDSVIGTMAYPSLSCGGELTLRQITTHSIELFEDLTYLGNNCLSRGTVVLESISSERLKYKWFYPNGKPGGTGSVHKVSFN